MHDSMVMMVLMMMQTPQVVEPVHASFPEPVHVLSERVVQFVRMQVEVFTRLVIFSPV
jgi:hypothetical protein